MWKKVTLVYNAVYCKQLCHEAFATIAFKSRPICKYWASFLWSLKLCSGFPNCKYWASFFYEARCSGYPNYI